MVESRSKSYSNVDDRESRTAGGANHALRSTQKLLLGLRVDRHDTRLAIHRQQCRASDLKPWSDAHRARVYYSISGRCACATGRTCGYATRSACARPLTNRGFDHGKGRLKPAPTYGVITPNLMKPGSEDRK